MMIVTGELKWDLLFSPDSVSTGDECSGIVARLELACICESKQLKKKNTKIEHGTRIIFKTAESSAVV